jgi:hypothetical protein
MAISSTEDSDQGHGVYSRFNNQFGITERAHIYIDEPVALVRTTSKIEAYDLISIYSKG